MLNAQTIFTSRSGHNDQNKKDLIIESFQNMDINMLEVLLDDDRTYQNATKDVFIAKLEAAFSEFKIQGDQYLHLYPGRCNSESCANKGCTGYSFIGDQSKSCVDFVFEESIDDVIDIACCNEFQTKQKDVEKSHNISITIYRDEEAGFKPTMAFLIKSQDGERAAEEIARYKDQVIGSQVYLPWV